MVLTPFFPMVFLEVFTLPSGFHRFFPCHPHLRQQRSQRLKVLRRGACCDGKDHVLLGVVPGEIWGEVTIKATLMCLSL